MRVLDTLRYLGDRVQLSVIVGSVPTDGSGDVSIVYANDIASDLFGYGSGVAMTGEDVRKLMPAEIAREHKSFVGGYLAESNKSSGTLLLRSRPKRIMGSWRNLKGVRLDGTLVDLQANVADIKNEGERYFIAFFRNRTEEVAQEEALREALDKAQSAQEEAERLAADNEKARKDAEDALKRQDDLSNQVNLLLNNLMSFSNNKPATEEVDPTAKAREVRPWLLSSVALAATILLIVAVQSQVPAALLVEEALLVLAGALSVTTATTLTKRV